jgi:hypothetical protein
MDGVEVAVRVKVTHGGVPGESVGPDEGATASHVPGGVSNHWIAVPTFVPQTFTVSLVNVLPEATWMSTSAPTVSVDDVGFGAAVSCAIVTAPLPEASTVKVVPVEGSLLTIVPVDPDGELDVPEAVAVDVAGAAGETGSGVVHELP